VVREPFAFHLVFIPISLQHSSTFRLSFVSYIVSQGTPGPLSLLGALTMYLTPLLLYSDTIFLGSFFRISSLLAIGVLPLPFGGAFSQKNAILEGGSLL